MHEINEYMNGYVSQLKATQLWFHSAHHVAKGKGFIADHKHLYGKIYPELDDHYDQLIEKSIALSGSEDVACPLILSKAVAHILNSKFTSPANLSSEEIVEIALNSIINLINSLSTLNEKFELSGYMTLGLDDIIGTMANSYENYLYLIGQRYKN